MTDLRKPLKRPRACCGETSRKFHGPDRSLQGFKQSVLADALSASKNQRVVDLLSWPLHAMREPINDMLGIIAENFADVVEPRPRLGRITLLADRWSIEVETGDVLALNPSTIRYQAITNEHGQARRPRHLLNRYIPVEPVAGADLLLVAVFVERGFAFVI
jgi:hypothetical protein